MEKIPFTRRNKRKKPKRGYAGLDLINEDV